MAEASLDATRVRVVGWKVVARKEFADHLLSIRFKILVALVGLAGIAAVYAVAGEIRNAAEQAADVPALFLRLFTISSERVSQFSYLTIVALLVPILGLAFGFDAVNGERAQGTLPRLIAQPIHRDDVINGKFVAGLSIIAIMIALLTLIVAGMGVVRLGITPSGAEVARVAVFWLISVIYAGFWLALSMLFSVLLPRAATSALASMAAWLVLTLFAGAIFGAIAGLLRPVPENATPLEEASAIRFELNMTRFSPHTLYGEASLVLLSPEVRAVGIVFAYQLDRAIPSELSLNQSLLVVWPQAVGLIAATVACFAGAYVAFMRQEVRA